MEIRINVSMLFSLLMIGSFYCEGSLIVEKPIVRDEEPMLEGFRVLSLLDKEEIKSILWGIVKKHEFCFTFGTVEENESSFRNWLIYSEALYALFRLGSEDAKSELKESIGRRRRRIEIIDCYTDGKPYCLCLLGIWNQVASFDKKERDLLIDAAESGKNIIAQDKKLAAFWRSYTPRFDDFDL